MRNPCVQVLLWVGIALMMHPVYLWAKQKTSPKSAIVVQVGKVTQTTLETTLQSWGSIYAVQQANLASQVDGQVSAVNYHDGYKGVQKDAVVLTLDSATEKAQVEADKVDVDVKKQALEAKQILLEESAVAKSEVLQAKADLLASQATLKKDQVALAQKSIKAPFTGDLGEFQKKLGDYVNAGDVLVTIVNKKQLEVKYDFPEVVVPQLKLGQAVLIHSSAYPKKTFTGKVIFIAPDIDQDTRSVLVKAALANPDDILSPGMFVSVDQIVKTEKDALIVPDEAIEYDRNKASVYRLVGQKAILTPVTLGQQHTKAGVHVIKGLKLGDIVITKGQEKLKDGDAVRVDMPKPQSKKLPQKQSHDPRPTTMLKS